MDTNCDVRASKVFQEICLKLAINASLILQGGKLDDITVLVAMVVEEEVPHISEAPIMPDASKIPVAEDFDPSLQPVSP